MSVSSCESPPRSRTHSRESSISSNSENDTPPFFKLMGVFDWEVRAPDYTSGCSTSSGPSADEMSLLAKDWHSTEATLAITSQLKTIVSPQSLDPHSEQPSLDIEEPINAQVERCEESDDWELSSMSEDDEGDVEMDDWEVSSLSDHDDGNSEIDELADDSSSEIDELADDDSDSSELVRATLELENSEESDDGEKMDIVEQKMEVIEPDKELDVDELESSDAGSSKRTRRTRRRPTPLYHKNGNPEARFVELYSGKPRTKARCFLNTKGVLDWDFASFDQTLPPGVTSLDVEQELRKVIEKRGAQWSKKRGVLFCLFDECQHTARTWKDWKRMVDMHFPPRFQCPDCMKQYRRSDVTLRHHRICTGLSSKGRKPKPTGQAYTDYCIQPVAYYFVPSVLQKLGYELF